MENWYVADPAQPGNPPQRVFYPRPGKENVSVRLGIIPVDSDGASPTWLEWDRTLYPYLGRVTWTEHGPLTLTVLSRDQTDLALLKVDTGTGKTSVLLTEHDNAWTNLPQDVPVWLSTENGGGFLWASERRGWRELERRAEDGQPGKGFAVSLADNDHEAAEANFHTLAGVAGDRVYAVCSRQMPGFTHLDFAKLDGSLDLKDRDEVAGLSPQFGMVQATFGDNPTVFTVQEQTLGSMPRTFVRRVGDPGAVGELPSVAVESPFVTNATLDGIGRPNSGMGPDRFASMTIRPRHFDPAAKRKYPVIVDVYGGPGHEQVVASMRPYLLDQWFADQGFIVVAIDGRGTPGRGRDWERAIAGHFGSVPLDDQVEALKLLGAKHPEMDMDRVGITGWSFGGYMSALAVLRRPDIFKAAVAGAPVSDWMDYDTCYTERYLGVPGAGRWPDAYKEGSLLTYADHLTRPLLLIHGTADDNVYFRHSLNLINALFRAGQPVDFLPLSSFTHMVPDPVVRSRLEERIVQYFQLHLGHPEPGAALNPATAP